MQSAEGDYAGTGDAAVEDNSLGRLLALSDGVFAIAMTLLILDLHVPDLLDDGDDARLRAALLLLLPNVLTYLLSFYVVAGYWFSHHQLMRSVTSTHPRLVQHTILLLLLVGALPFPAALLAQYGGRPTALVVYAGVNVLAALVLLWLRHDVRVHGLATAAADPDEAFRWGWRIRGNLVVFVLCIPAAYLLGSHAPYVLLLLIVSHRGAPLWARWRRHRLARTA